MKRVVYALVVTAAALMPLPASANPTGAPLVSYPVEPCRFLDTRVSGALQGGTVMRAWVRGILLSADNGAAQSDCGVPKTAEAVRVNIVVFQPTTSGHLKINGVGTVHGPQGVYSRINFNAGLNVSNEITISLCNLFEPHQACPFDDVGRFLDFEILNMSAGPVHVVGDVVEYLQRFIIAR